MVHLSLDNQQSWLAWNTSTTEPEGTAGGAPPPGVDCVHKTVCAAYFLPAKYQSTSNASGSEVSSGIHLQALGLQESHCYTAVHALGQHLFSRSVQVDRRPPRPSRKSHVKLLKAPSFQAFASGFRGFPTPPRHVHGEWLSPLEAYAEPVTAEVGVGGAVQVHVADHGAGAQAALAPRGI